ncbi:MAG: hypothetical protein ACUVQ6_01690 [Dissulfurimicrobium sp.]
MTGINFLACWNFTGISSKMILYVFAEGGPMYKNLDLSGLGAKFNGNYQAGVEAYYFVYRLMFPSRGKTMRNP